MRWSAINRPRELERRTRYRNAALYILQVIDHPFAWSGQVGHARRTCADSFRAQRRRSAKALPATRRVPSHARHFRTEIVTIRDAQIDIQQTNRS